MATVRTLELLLTDVEFKISAASVAGKDAAFAFIDGLAGLSGAREAIAGVSRWSQGRWGGAIRRHRRRLSLSSRAVAPAAEGEARSVLPRAAAHPKQEPIRACPPSRRGFVPGVGRPRSPAPIV